MNNLVWKAIALAAVMLACGTLVLRAGKTKLATEANVPSAPSATPAAARVVAPLAAFNVTAPATAANATTANATTPQFASPCVATIPRSWGQYRGGSSQSGLAFEASDGTLRFITNLPCGATPVVALEVRRTAGTGGDSLD